jgi:serine protease AprX
MKVIPVRYIFLFSVFLLTLSLNAQDKYWIYFTDKGESLTKVDWNNVEKQFSERSLQRRAKVQTSDESLLNITDASVWQPYVAALKSYGIKPVVVSKWLNAVSAELSDEQVDLLEKLSFVEKITKVRRGVRRLEPELLSKSSTPFNTHSIGYGASLVQNAQIKVPEVHSAGVTGEGVLIAILDTGFYLDHEVFNEMNVVATFDFINGDENVDNEPGDVSSQNSHGTKVLSIIGGYSPGNLIGPAFNSSYLLAKTEDTSGETSVEEDYWIAAAEWADQLGADIISTSVGYIDWYDYADMNGQTAPITIAADMAVEKGIVVVVSAGNEGDGSWRYITTPADGFDVISVGAVTDNNVISGFSSLGPTSDGRIKPEVVAMGVSNALAFPNGNSYGRGNGTSYSCPLVAGTAALILSAHPELTPKQVRQALLQTADRATLPGNTYGWGLVDALQAVNYWGSITVPAEENLLLSAYPNPFSYKIHSGLTFLIDLEEYSDVTIDLYNILGQRLGPIVKTSLPASQKRAVYWDGLKVSGKRVPSGIYFYRIQIGDYSAMGKMTILQ